MKKEKQKRGVKPHYGEETTTLAFRVPLSRRQEMRKTVNRMLKQMKDEYEAGQGREAENKP